MLFGLTIEEEEASDDLLGFRERTVDDGAFAASNLDPHPFGIRPERVAGLVHAAGLEIIGEAEHALVSQPPLYRRSVPSSFSLLQDQQQVRHDTNALT